MNGCDFERLTGRSTRGKKHLDYERETRSASIRWIYLFSLRAWPKVLLESHPPFQSPNPNRNELNNNGRTNLSLRPAPPENGRNLFEASTSNGSPPDSAPPSINLIPCLHNSPTRLPPFGAVSIPPLKIASTL